MTDRDAVVNGRFSLPRGIPVGHIGRADFQTAVHSAETGLAKYGPSQITRIPIDQARDAGIFPMP